MRRRAGIAIREHVARAAMVHPGRVIVDGETVRTEFQPLTRYPVRIEEDSESVRVTDAGLSGDGYRARSGLLATTPELRPLGRRGRRSAVDRTVRPAGS